MAKVAGDDVTVAGGTGSFADRNVGTGKPVTVTGYTLAGKRWRCEEPVRRITIRDGAQVVFQAPLIDLLK